MVNTSLHVLGWLSKLHVFISEQLLGADLGLFTETDYCRGADWPNQYYRRLVAGIRWEGGGTPRGPG